VCEFYLFSVYVEGFLVYKVDFVRLFKFMYLFNLTKCVCILLDLNAHILSIDDGCSGVQVCLSLLCHVHCVSGLCVFILVITE
jgi:hypothetical protein